MAAIVVDKVANPSIRTWYESPSRTAQERLDAQDRLIYGGEDFYVVESAANVLGFVGKWKNTTVELTDTEKAFVKSLSTGQLNQAGNIPAAYNEELTYNIGDQVYHEGRLYQATADGITGLFEAGDWETGITASEKRMVETWHDGNTMYRRAFTGTTAASNTGQTNIPHGVGSAPKIVNFGGWVEEGVGSGIVAIPYASTGVSLSLESDATNFILSHEAPDVRFNARPYELWVQYIK